MKREEVTLQGHLFGSDLCGFWCLTIEHFLLREVPDGDLLGVPSSLGDDTSQVGRSCLFKAGVVQDLYEPVV